MTVIWRIFRAPFTLASLVIGTVLMFMYLASISVGGWYETLIVRAWPTAPGWLPASLGVMTFAIAGIVFPAVIMAQVIGWPGILLGPTLMVLIVSRLDHW